MKQNLIIVFFMFAALSAVSQIATVQSPNSKINVAVFCGKTGDTGNWYLQVNYSGDGKTSGVIPRIDLGISREDQNFSKELKFIKAGKTLLINEEYTMLHGKRSHCSNSGNERVLYFENPSKAKLDLVVRAYDDGCKNTIMEAKAFMTVWIMPVFSKTGVTRHFLMHMIIHAGTLSTNLT